MADNATFYIADPSMLSSHLFDHLPIIQKAEDRSKDNSATGLTLTIPQATITMNFMPPTQMESHVRGFAGWVDKALQNEDQRIYVRSRIYYVRLVIGCVIEPGFDRAREVEKFLLEFNSALNGLLFMFNTVFDFDGKPVAGYFYDLERTSQ